jgi:EAL domain-containing protein (putative c-di-GMP-specific phosphodiesterase class I)/GGDEF domain-containing protein
VTFQVERQFAGTQFLLLRLQKNLQTDAELERARLPILAEPGQIDSQITQYLAEQQPFALVALRLKNYGEWADVFGFSEAGELFARFSQRLLAATLRFGTLGYLANEVFLLLLPYVRDELLVHQQLSDIQTALRQEDTISESYFPKLSISYCMAPQDGESARQLITNVLISNRIQLNSPLSFYSRYSEQMADKKRLQLQISDALYRAVELDQLELHFQPKLDLAKQRCTSVEALLRWHHPQLGMVSPALFIPVAEQDGQINEIGLWVVRQICRQLPALQAMGIDKVAFNVSGVQLQQPGFLEAVGQILHNSAVDAAALEAELTESWMVSDLALSNMQLAGLKALGLQIAMDDFGTGYSSLAALSRLPVDVLKIDRQLIMELESSLHSQSMVGNVTRMAHELGLQVVVEGVETAEQLRILQELQVDAIQGFYISRPVPLSALPAVLAGGSYVS